MNRRTEKLYTRLTPEDSKALDLRCANLRISRPDGAELAIRNWLNENLHPQASPQEPVEKLDAYDTIRTAKGQQEILTAEEWRWVERVLGIVRQGPPEAKRALDSNLDAFVYLSELANRAAAAGASPSDERSAPDIPHTPADIQKAFEGVRRIEEETHRVLERLVRPGEAVPGQREGTTGSRGPARPGRKRDPGRPGERS